MAARPFTKHLLSFTIALTLGFGLPAGTGVGVNPSSAQVSWVSKLVINIPSRTLWVYEGDKIVQYYPVGVGRPGYMTPLGQFTVIRKIIDPGWEHPYKAAGAIRIAPGETNPLGSRWIGFHRKNGGEYGMHGTDNPRSVGRFSSHGCVRMKTKDIEALFEIVDIGTPVNVVYETVLIRRKGDDIRLVVFKDAFGRGMPSAQEVYDRIIAEYPTARVDMDKVRTALGQPNERPFEVATVPSQDETAPIAEQPASENGVHMSGDVPPLAPIDTLPIQAPLQ